MGVAFKSFRSLRQIKKSCWILFVAAHLICLGSAKATQAIEPLVISTSQGRFELGPHLEIMEDQNRQWTIDDVSASSFSGRFHPIDSKVINLGITDSTIWIRFSIDAKSLGKDASYPYQQWYLDFDRDFLERCGLFIPMTSGEGQSVKARWQVIGSAAGNTMAERQPVSLPLKFQFPSMVQSPMTFYLRVQHSSSLFLPVTLFSEDAFHSHWKNRMFWYGSYYGTIFAMFLFNLFFFASLRERIYLYYLFYVASIAAYFLFFNGIFIEFFLPDRYQLHQKLNLACLGLTIFWGVYFAKNFLVTKKISPIIDKLFNTILVLTVILVVISPFSRLSFLNQFSSILGTVSPIMVIVATAICWRQGYRPVVFFLTAWTILCIGGLVFALTFRGLIPYSPATINSFQLGSGLEVVVLSFAVAHRMRILRREHERIKDTFGKYITNEVRDEILYSGIPLDGEIKQVTILFSDLRDFTPLVESTPPKEVVEIINGYFSEMVKAIQNHRGLILQFVGDEIESVFGAPLPLDDHPPHAVNAALEMRHRLERVNDTLRSQNYAPLRHGIGIHTGQVLAANIGGLDRLSYALVGDSVIVASRIQQLNKKYKTDILISESTHAAIGKDFNSKAIETTTLIGRTQPIGIFAID